MLAKYYNSRVKPQLFFPGDLVLRKVFQNTQELGAGEFAPNWEGPYKVVQIVRPGVYELEDMGAPWPPMEHWTSEEVLSVNMFQCNP